MSLVVSGEKLFIFECLFRDEDTDKIRLEIAHCAIPLCKKASLKRANLSSRSHVMCLVIQASYEMLDLLTLVFLIRQ
jgi:hypothetical protein